MVQYSFHSCYAPAFMGYVYTRAGKVFRAETPVRLLYAGACLDADSILDIGLSFVSLLLESLVEPDDCSDAGHASDDVDILDCEFLVGGAARGIQISKPCFGNAVCINCKTDSRDFSCNACGRQGYGPNSWPCPC